MAPSQSLTPGRRPVYIHEEPLGNGAFGQVDKVIDVSTGAIYAQKTFHKPLWANHTERKRRQKEKWLDSIRREIRIMKEHPHVSMITRADETNIDHPKGTHRFTLGFLGGPAAFLHDAI